MKKTKKLMVAFMVMLFAITFATITPKTVQAATTKHVTVKFYDPIKKKVIKKETVKKGKTVKPPKAPKHKGYKFVKWSSKKYKKAKKNVTIKAVYRKRTYTVDFFDGVTCEHIKRVKVRYNDPVKPPKMDNIFTADGKRYMFIGWDEKLNHVKEDMSVYSVAKELNGSADKWAETYLSDCYGQIVIGSTRIKGTYIRNHELYNSLTTDQQRKAYKDFVAYLERGEDLGSSFFDFASDVNDGFAGVASVVEYEYFGQCNTGNPYYDVSEYTLANYQKNKETVKQIGSIAEQLIAKNGTLPTGASYITERIASGVFVNYICNKLSYESGARYSSDSLNTSFGNCQAYAKLYKAMCNTVGIDCGLVYGYANSGYHMWNRVKLDGQWYYVDLCWADDGKNQIEKYYMYSKTVWPDHELKKFDF